MCWFFFFFKQKTAYEMRISDWSSDVCSSDLSQRPLEKALLFRVWAMYDRDADAGELDGEAAEKSEAEAEARRESEGKNEDEDDDSKIGRASCRERVCQYW